MKPSIKIFGLPDQNENDYVRLHEAIVRIFVMAQVGVLDEKDMFVWMPDDRMKKGLGEEIEYDIYLEDLPPMVFPDSCRQVLKGYIQNVIIKFFPKADVQGKINKS